MIAQATYIERFSTLKPFLEKIFREIKKEIRQELQSKGSLLRKNLGAQSFHPEFKKISSLLEECITSSEGEVVGEWIAAAWISSKAGIFSLFDEYLSEVAEDYHTLTSLPADVEEKMVKEGVELFGAKNIYIFSILNSVVFSAATLEKLKKEAENAGG
jgi:hypothetical protein